MEIYMQILGNLASFRPPPYQICVNLLLAADMLARAYHKLPHEILSNPVEAIFLDLEALASTMPLKPSPAESFTEQIKRRRRELGLVV